MAELPVNMGMLSHDEERVVDDDVSSSSDRSFDADDGDSSSRIDSGATRHQINTESVRSRRRRRQGSHGSRRQKGGSRHRHKGYSPYSVKGDDLQLKQRSIELQEKENAAAVVRHEVGEHFVTFPIAPFNSTQFLMDEHSQSPPTDGIHNHSISAAGTLSPQDVQIHSVPSTPAECSHDTITFEKKDQEFTDFYATAHAECLQSLPKAELVKNFINLEEKIAVLQKKVAENQQRQDGDFCSPFGRHFDSNCNSDANSLSSNNEEFLDLSTINQISDCLHNSNNLSTVIQKSDCVHDLKNLSTINQTSDSDCVHDSNLSTINQTSDCVHDSNNLSTINQTSDCVHDSNNLSTINQTSDCVHDSNNLSTINQTSDCVHDSNNLSTINQTSGCVHDSGDADSSFTGNITLCSHDNLS